jgi:hypothetical protein
MGALRNTAVFIVGAVLFVATILISSIFLIGITWLTTVLYPFVQFIESLTLQSCFFILLPLGFFKTTRTFAATGFAVAAMVMAITVWLKSVLVVYQYWGFIGLSAGIILGIVGIVPLGLAAAAMNQLWAAVGQISLGIALYFGLYILGIYLRSTMKIQAWTPSTATPPAPENPDPS